MSTKLAASRRPSIRAKFEKIKHLPLEALPAAVLAIVALGVDSHWRWLPAALAVVLTLVLLRNDTGLRLVAAVVATAFFATAVYWEDIGGWRLAFLAGGVLAIWVARWIGAIVWPDVAIIFLAGLAVVAVRDAREQQRPPPSLPAVVVLDLPEDRIRPPANELRAPSNVEIVALVPEDSTESGELEHATLRFDALLLTPVPRSGPTEPVRVLVDRGDGSTNVRDLARARLDATELVLLPASECFVASEREKLTKEQAETVLEAHGFPDETAQDFTESFSGRIDLVAVRPGPRFRRYFSGKSTVGRFLTKKRFRDSEAAVDGLDLPPSNRAELVQTVSVLRPTMTLRGGIKNGDEDALQFLVLRTPCFEYGPGRKLSNGG